MSNFTEERNPEWTESDAYEYDQLVDPDAEDTGPANSGGQITESMEVQQSILGSVMQDIGIARHALTLIKPDNFSTKYHKAIARVIWHHVKEYATLPSKHILKAELPKQLQAKDYEDLQLGRMEVDFCLKAYVPGLDPPDYTLAKIKDFATRSALKTLALDITSTLKDHKTDAAKLLETFAKLNAAQPPCNVKANDNDLLSLASLRDSANKIERVFIAENWLQAGHVSVLSGREKRGKSTCMYDLMTALISGQKWMDYIPTTVSPVILLDYENPADYVWQNIARMLAARGVEVDAVDHLYGQINPEVIRSQASPIGVDYALDLISRMEKRTGLHTGLFVVDTAAPAFAKLFTDPGWTNNNVQVRQAIEIGQEIARRSNWHVIIIYHDNKSGNGASGSYEWYGTPDVFMRFEREDKAVKGKLTLTGRLLNPPKPVEFSFRDGLLYGRDEGTEKQESASNEYHDFLVSLSTDPTCQNDIVKNSKWGKSQVLNWLEQGNKAGHIGFCRGDKNAKLYWGVGGVFTPCV